MLAFRHEIIHIAMWCQITATATKESAANLIQGEGGNKGRLKRGLGFLNFGTMKRIAFLNKCTIKVSFRYSGQCPGTSGPSVTYLSSVPVSLLFRKHHMRRIKYFPGEAEGLFICLPGK